MTRAGYIRARLARAQDAGAIRSYQSYSPGDSRGRRWVIATDRVERVLTTREVEVYVAGIEAGFESRFTEVTS